MWHVIFTKNFVAGNLKGISVPCKCSFPTRKTAKKYFDTLAKIANTKQIKRELLSNCSKYTINTNIQMWSDLIE